MDSLTPIFALALVHFAAVAAPGANFLAVTKNALAYSRRSGMITARGVATGTLIYVTLGFLGFAVILSQSPLLLKLLRGVGALYFGYLGYKLLTARPRSQTVVTAEGSLTTRQAFGNGLFTSLSNPAASLYFVSLFTTFIPTTAPVGQKLVIVLMLPLISLSWYTIIALTFSNVRIRQFYERFERPMNILFGLMWIGLAIKLALG